MGIIREFKEFAIKGNVVDLAVAVIIGSAFGKIVSSFVEDVITPLLLNPALERAGAENISKLAWNGVTYGNFLAAVINFFCIALVMFLMIKGINTLSRPAEVIIPGPTEDQKLLTEIRDLLKNK